MNGEYAGFKADVASATDYYPFGMEMPGRSFSSENNRFGYNGQEKDNEVRGTGNSYAYEYRMYDSRIGRFLSIDPLAKSYPWYTPYQFAGNTPIMAIDLEGLEPYVTIKNVYHNNGYVKFVADVHIVGKVINMSSLKDINMKVVAANLQSDLISLSGLGYDIFKSPYKLKPDGKGSGTPVLSDVTQMHVVYDVTVTADIRSVENIDQLSANDWVFAITDEVIGTKEKEYSGIAMMGGKVAIGEGREYGFGNNLEGRALTFHEFLHLLGAEDIYDTPKDDKNNAMSNGRGLKLLTSQKAQIWNFTIGPWQTPWNGAKKKNYSRPKGIFENEDTKKQLKKFAEEHSR